MIEIYNKLVSDLNKKYKINDDDKNLVVTCNKIANGLSFKIGAGYTPVVVESNKSKTRLFIKMNIFSKIDVDFSIRNVHTLKSKSDYQAVDFQLNEDLSEFIVPYLEYAIINYTPPKSFACCSRFLECSNAKKCIHPNQIHSKECYYRRNLEKGLIFYGENQNQ